MTTLEIEYPEDLLRSERLTKNDLEQLAQEAFLVRLYELEHISSGQAAHLLGISRREFLNLLGKYNVSYFDE